jgi:RNA ligase (TIGR02306 family)
MSLTFETDGKTMTLDEVLARPPLPTFKAEIVTVREVTKHPDADRLDLLTFNEYDWVVITSKVGVPSANDHVEGGMEMVYRSRYEPGDKVIYIPIDSILPEKLELYLFPPDSKITLSKHRVKTIRIRKCISQGMTADLTDEIFALYPRLKHAKVGDDITEILGITKYEPAASALPNNMKGTAKRHVNEYFKQYTDIQNFKYYPALFEGKLVNVTEKIHGTSARYAYLPKTPRKLSSVNFRPYLKPFDMRCWQFCLTERYNAVKQVVWDVYLTVRDQLFYPLGLLPKYEYVFGSRRVQLQDKLPGHKTFHDDNVYEIIGNQLNLKAVLEPGEAVYGEIVGPGIQKKKGNAYTYGCEQGEYRLFAYDVQVDGKYLDTDEFELWCDQHNIQRVPKLWEGIFDYEKINDYRSGDSTVGGQKIREGVVVRTCSEEVNPVLGRSLLKWINDDYLLQEDIDGDFH